MGSYVPEYDALELSPKQRDTLLIIPVINEGLRILAQLEKIEKLGFEIDVAIADGGSTDGSLDDFLKLERLGVNYLLKKWGPGKLSAQLLCAFEFALKRNYKQVITMDGNLKDDPEGIRTIIAALNSGFDFVQGSRFIDGGSAINTPAVRYYAIRWIHAPLTSIAARRKFTDTTNGFRGFSNMLLQNEKIDIFRQCFDSYELLFYLPIRASRIGLSICEVPVIRMYPRKGPTPTKIRGLGSHLVLFQILLNAIFGRYNPRGRKDV